MTNVRTPYGPRKRVQEFNDEPPRTKQSFKKECDINNIMAKFQKTGAITHVRDHGANYGFATSTDFHQAMNTVAKANEMFDALPSTIRSRFNGDPGAFLDFVQDPENEDEMRKLKLLPAKPEPVRDPEPAPAPTPPPES